MGSKVTGQVRGQETVILAKEQTSGLGMGGLSSRGIYCVSARDLDVLDPKPCWAENLC